MREKLNLPSVTAICIDGKPLTEEIKLRYQTIVKFMISKINFAKVKLVMVDDPEIEGAEFIKIDPINSYPEWNQYCLSELHTHVDTDFCLIFQTDGFVVNPELWRPIFLEYDYIGAPWPPLHPWPEPTRMDRRVGNGGFCIRSKKLLDATKDFIADNNEDIMIVSKYRDELDSKGFKFAPLNIATEFSIETQFMQSQAIHSCFGFHGKYRVDEALRILEQKS
jgi:hypothetical protein